MSGVRVFALLILAACTGGAPEEEATQDVKVDRHPQEALVESSGPRSCASEGRLHVVWQDQKVKADGAADGPSSIWFNSSEDGGLTWMTGDIPLNTPGEDVVANASAPDIACAGDNVYVVWEDERDGDLLYRNIYMNVSTNGGRDWLTHDVAIDGDPEGEAMSLGPRVAAVGDEVYVTWFDNRNGAYDILVQGSADRGTTWLAEASRADTDSEGSAYSAWPRLATTGDGRVVVVWEDSRSGGSDIYANVSTDGGETFTDDDARLDKGDDNGESNSFLPSVAMEGDHAYAVWHDERNGENRDVFFNASSDGGLDWLDEAVRIDSDAVGQADSINPVVAATGDRVHVAWQDGRSGGYDVYHRFSRDGGESWAGEEMRMDTDAGGESQSYDPVLLVKDDTIVVAWQDRRADAENVGFNDLYYNWSGDGGKNWSFEDLRINSNAPGSAYAVDVSLALDGDSFVTLWADGRFGSSDVFAANRALGAESVYVAPAEPEEGED